MIRHKQEWANRGDRLSADFARSRLSFQTLREAKELAREVAQYRKAVEAAVPGDDVPALLFVLDLAGAESNSSRVLSMVRPVAELLQQSPWHALVLLYGPSRSGVKMETKLKLERAIEDGLISGGASLDAEGSLHFRPEEHASDLRALHLRYKLVVASVHEDSCPWLSTAVARGNGGEHRLIRVRDMELPATVLVTTNPNKGTRRLGPRERSGQRGSEVFVGLLEKLLQPVVQKGVRVGLCHLLPPDWVDLPLAALNLLLPPTNCRLAYRGFGYAEEGAGGDAPPSSPTLDALTAVTTAKVRELWWPSQVEAGPREPTGQAEEVQKPQLKVCHWVGDIPVILETVGSSFSADSPQVSVWMGLAAAHQKKYGVPPAAAAAPGPSRASTASGPDFSVAPMPKDIAATWEPEGVDTPPDWSFEGHPRRSDLVTVSVAKDRGIWLYLAPEATECGTITLEPQEVAGFGTGKYKECNGGDAPAKCLLFSLASDADLVVVQPEGGSAAKTVKPLAAVLFDLAFNEGCSNVQVANHSVEARQEFQRYSVRRATSDVWAFEPDEVAPGSDIKSKQVAAGVFVDCEAAATPVLPTEKAGVVWELRLEKLNPPALTLVQPKLWLLCSMKVEMGKYYKLE